MIAIKNRQRLSIIKTTGKKKKQSVKNLTELKMNLNMIPNLNTQISEHASENVGFGGMHLTVPG